MSLAPSALVANRYEIERLAGSGGMGAVYRARDSYSNEWVALKVLHAQNAAGQETERFAREAQLLSELRHPGIVSYVAHGQLPDGRPYLAMEWIDGEDLGARLRRSLLTVQESVELITQVASALAMAHRRRIVHRDLSH
jgi:serine/threonine protein kinase